MKTYGIFGRNLSFYEGCPVKQHIVMQINNYIPKKCSVFELHPHGFHQRAYSQSRNICVSQTNNSSYIHHGYYHRNKYMQNKNSMNYKHLSKDTALNHNDTDLAVKGSKIIYKKRNLSCFKRSNSFVNYMLSSKCKNMFTNASLQHHFRIMQKLNSS